MNHSWCFIVLKIFYRHLAQELFINSKMERDDMKFAVVLHKYKVFILKLLIAIKQTHGC